MNREIKYHSKGLSFIDANHLVYAEGVLASNRRKEGRKLNILDEPYDCCNMCESDVPVSEGEMVEVLTSESDGDLMWLCQKCRDD